MAERARTVRNYCEERVMSLEAKYAVKFVGYHWLDTYHIDGFRYDCVPNYWDGPMGVGYASLVYETYQLAKAKIAQGQSYWKRFDAGPGAPLALVQMAEQLEDPEGVLRTSYSNSTWRRRGDRALLVPDWRKLCRGAPWRPPRSEGRRRSAADRAHDPFALRPDLDKGRGLKLSPACRLLQRDNEAENAIGYRQAAQRIDGVR